MPQCVLLINKYNARKCINSSQESTRLQHIFIFVAHHLCWSKIHSLPHARYIRIHSHHAAYSTQFSIRTSSAGSDDCEARKASIGLGLGLPSDVLTTSVHAHTGTGLGIYVDSWLLDSPESPEPSPPASPTMPSLPLPSPPLLAPRRSPRKPPAETPGNEFAPMRTPPPSLRGLPSGDDGYFVIALPAPAVPTLPSTPTLPCGPFPGGGGGGDGSGGGLVDIGLSVIEMAEMDFLMSSLREVSAATTAGSKLVGLGLSLPCLDEAELITTLEPQSTAHAAGVGLGIDLSFLEGGADTSDDSELDSELESALPSPWSRAASASPELGAAHPKSMWAYRCVDFALDGEEGECPGSPDGASPRASPCEGPTLGFDSPFWATYASTFHEDM